MQFFICILCCIFCILQPALAISPHSKTSLNIEVDKGITVAVDVYMPSRLVSPRALVIVSPGSDGTAEAVFEKLKREDTTLEDTDLLANALNNAGYAVALFWQRGFIRAKDCVKGSDYEERKKSYVANCYIREIRGKLDLNITTLDTEKVYKTLSVNRLTKGLPVVSLAISEGSHHVSKLIQLKKIDPEGVVFIGGIFDSLAETFAYQFRYDFYFEKIKFAFDKTKKDIISYNEMVDLGILNHLTDPPYIAPWHAGIALGGLAITKSDVETRRVLFNNNYEKFITELPSKPLGVPTDGVYDKLIAPSLISSSYIAQVFSSKTKIVDQLATYDGKVIFLYGSFENLIKLPANDACPYQKLNCKIEIINGVGHYLQERPGYRPERSFNAILNAIKEVQRTAGSTK